MRLNFPFIYLMSTGLLACNMQPKDVERSSPRSPPASHYGSRSGSGDQKKADQLPPSSSLGLAENPRLRFKRQTLLQADLHTALELPKAEICRELGELDCISEVHHIELGGVDAYERAIYEPQEKTSATTPIIIERIILKACHTRLQLDQGSGTGAILTGDARQTGTTLVNRAFLREPTAAEITGFRRLYQRLGAAKGAMAACYATFTSTEFLFY